MQIIGASNESAPLGSPTTGNDDADQTHRKCMSRSSGPAELLSLRG
jgi:hypothetical protein